MLSESFGGSGLSFEPDRFASLGDDDYEKALEQWRAEPPVRVIFENGAGSDEPGAPVGRFEKSFESWPPTDVRRRVFFLARDGALLDAAPSAASAASFRHDPNAGMRTFLGAAGYQVLERLWDIDWSHFAEGELVAYLTEPFAEDTVIAGPGHVELYVKSSADRAHVQVSVSEVRPDGNEYLVQSGWLALGHRKVDESRGDDFRVYHSYRREDFEPMPIDQYERVLVAIPSLAHAFRAGSRLRLTLSSPGRNHALWQFEAPKYDVSPVLTVAEGGDRASALVLPVVDGVAVADGYPPCPALRGQPCRPYVPVANAKGEGS
jgi:predicted acyl esterase